MSLMMRFCLLLVVVLFSAAVTAGCGSTGGEATTTTTAASTTTTSSTTTTTVAGASISGQVAASSGDLSALNISALGIEKPKFRTLASSVVEGAEVKLYQVATNGAETDTGKTAITDASGNYTISGITPLTSGIYRAVASKQSGSETLNVSTIAIVASAAAQSVNIAPETTIADKMFDSVIKGEFANVIVEQDTLEELKYMVTDDTETLVNNGKLALPSMLSSKASQVIAAANAMGKNLGNAEKAFAKLQIENEANNASTAQNLNSAMKAINEMTNKGLGDSYMPAQQANVGLAQAYLQNTTKTISEIVDATNSSITNPQRPIVLADVLTSFEAKLDSIQQKYEQIKVDGANVTLNDPEFFAFTETERQATLTSASPLEVLQQVALKNYIEQNYGAADDIKFASQLGYSTPNVSLNSPAIEDYFIYYGSYGDWKVVGNARVRMPSTPAYQSAVVDKVELVQASDGTVVGTMTSEGVNSRSFAFNVNSGNTGPILTPGTTYRYQLKGTVSNVSGAAASSIKALATSETFLSPVITLECIAIPGPNIFRIDGTPLQSMNTNYYTLPTVSDKKPIIVWSTAEVASVTIPDGFGWAYAMEITRYGTKNGTTTLEVDDTDSTPVYSSGTDLGSLFTTSSFLNPAELVETYNGEPVCYRVYVQRVLLNAEGKYNGIAAGSFNYIRYAP